MEKDEDVDSIFINMYGGQLPADKVAFVVREAVTKNYCSKPIVCRFKGAQAEEGSKILKDLNSSKVLVVEDFEEAAIMVEKQAQLEI